MERIPAATARPTLNKRSILIRQRLNLIHPFDVDNAPNNEGVIGVVKCASIEAASYPTA
jgi:hypothetical protein